MTQTRWQAVAVLFLAGVVAAMQFAKITPVLDQLQGAFDLSSVSLGWLISAIGFMGVLLSVVIVRPIGRLGMKRALLMGLLLSAACALLETWVTTATALLTVRVVEGLSQLLIVVAAPTLMALESSEADQPLTLSIWGMFFGVGFAITNFLAPTLIAWQGWQGVFYGHAAFSVLALFGVLALVRTTPPIPVPTVHRGFISAHQWTYADPGRRLVSLAFLCHTLMFVVLLTFTSRYFTQVMGMPTAQASVWAGVLSLVTLLGTLTSGFVLRVTRAPGLPLILGFVLLLLCVITLFGVPLNLIGVSAKIGVALALLTLAGMIQGLVFASVPLVAQSAGALAQTNGAISQMGNLGSFLGAPLFGLAFASWQWSGGAVFLSICAVLGGAVAWFLRAHMHMQRH